MKLWEVNFRIAIETSGKTKEDAIKDATEHVQHVFGGIDKIEVLEVVDMSK